MRENGVQVPITRIVPPSPWAPLDLQELLRFRGLGVRLARRDITLRYRQTALGIAWVVLQPLLAAGAFTFIFGTVAGLSQESRVPYFLLSFWGALLFNTFSGCFSRASASLLNSGSLVGKVYLPRLLLPLSTIGSVSLDAIVAAVLGLIMGIVVGAPPGLAAVTLPVWFASAIVWGLAGGIATAPLAVRYRDIGYVLPLLLQLLLYVSPVGYTLATVPSSIRVLYLLNPLASLLEGVRWSAMSASPSPPWLGVVLSFFAGIVLLLAACLVFRRQERFVADVL